MAKSKKRKEWMAIISHDYHDGKKMVVRPLVLESEDGEIATFSSVEEIEAVSMKHLLAGCVWTAFNFTSGEAVVL